MKHGVVPLRGLADFSKGRWGQQALEQSGIRRREGRDLPLMAVVSWATIKEWGNRQKRST